MLNRFLITVLSFLSWIYKYSLDNGVVATTSLSNTAIARRLLDIELHCKDGLVMASAQHLGASSVVFEKMLFSAVKMEESRTSIIHLDDVLMDDMELLLKFCYFHRDYSSLVHYLSKDSTISTISIAHRFEFTDALEILCDHLVEEFSEPLPADIQFADRLNLENVLVQWSQSLDSPKLYAQFVLGLVEYPLSAETVKLFVETQFGAQMMPKCLRCVSCVVNGLSLHHIVFIECKCYGVVIRI